jgi:hypothetical protein
MAINLENYYEFECELSDGTTETLKVPRVTTRIKFKLGMAINKLGKDAEDEELAELLIDRLCPGLMERVGPKSPTMAALGNLFAKIVEVDGDMIFGSYWRKKSKKSPRKAVKKKQSGTKKKAKKKKTS